MSLSQVLLAAALMQQGLFVAVWLTNARLRMAPVAAGHWALGAGLAAAGMALYLQRGTMSEWLTVVLANLCVVGGTLSLRRGVQHFAKQRTTDREHMAVLALTTFGLVAAVGRHQGFWLVAIIASGALAWTLLRAAHEVRRDLAEEYSQRGAAWCAVPFGLIGLTFLVRTLLTLWVGPPLVGDITAQGSINVGVSFASMFFGLVVNLALIALTVTRLVRRLQYQSDHDLVTGLWNRRAMQRMLLEEVQRQRRFATPFAVLSIDIDHFKRVNDQYGHDVGDAVLRRVGQTLRDASREVDRVARMGGEEYCVLLAGASRQEAECTAERLRRTVGAIVHPEMATPDAVTISIGLAMADACGEPVTALLRRLDKALYAAKHGGRDCVRVADRSEPAPVA